jgi:hypothetical protein
MWEHKEYLYAIFVFRSNGFYFHYFMLGALPAHHFDK